MTKSKLFVIFGVAVLGITLVYTVLAQAPAGQKQTPASVALVDIDYIMGQNARVDTEIAKVNEKYNQLLQAEAARGEEIQKMRAEMSRLDPNSAAYRAKEQEMVSRSSDISARRMLLVKEMTEARMTVLRNTYELTLKETERVARHFGMTIVLNYDRQELPKNAPIMPSVQQYEQYMMQYTHMMTARAVVWSNSDAVDLTNLVLNTIHRAHPDTVRPNTASTAQPAAAAGRVGAGAPAAPRQ